MTNRRRGGKTRKKTPAQRKHEAAVEAAAHQIQTIPRPRLNRVCTAVKVELAAQAAEARRDAQK